MNEELRLIEENVSCERSLKQGSVTVNATAERQAIQQAIVHG